MFVYSLSLLVPLDLHVILEKSIEIPLGLLQAFLDECKGRLGVEVRDLAIDVAVECILRRHVRAVACLGRELVEVAQSAAHLHARC